jgi:tetratricopeptide (TPR) repeat protein
LFILAFAYLVPAGALAADCTMAQLAISPYSVIDPCTARLQQQGLTKTDKSLAHFVRGRGYHRTKRLDLAEGDYRKAFDLDPKNADILVSWSNVDLRKGDGSAYTARVEKAYELNPNNPSVLRVVGAMFQTFGDHEKALEFYGRALSIDPPEPFALYFRSSIYSKQRKFKEAIADADALVAIPRKTLDEYGFLNHDGVVQDFLSAALIQRADILSEAGQVEPAGRDYDAAVAAERSVRALLSRGWFLRGMADRRLDALRDLEEVLAAEPRNGEALYSLAFTLAELERHEEAFEAFDARIKLRPYDGVSLGMRARLHRQFGRTDEAVRDLEKAVMIDPRERERTMRSLRRAGYWTSQQTPQEMMPELRDAIRACMLDTMCN